MHMPGSRDGNGLHRLITAKTLGNRSLEVPSVAVAGDLTTQQRTGVAVETPLAELYRASSSIIYNAEQAQKTMQSIAAR